MEVDIFLFVLIFYALSKITIRGMDEYSKYVCHIHVEWPLDCVLVGFFSEQCTAALN